MRIHEIANKLSEKINLYKANKTRPVNASEYNLEPDNSWGACYLFADVLYKSSLPENLLVTKEKLDEIVEKFNSNTGHQVKSSDLINKGWIRIVFGTVALPSLIRSVIFDFEKVEHLFPELIFFHQLSPDDRKRLTTEELLKDTVNDYNRLHTMLLKIEESKGVFWNLKDDHVEFYKTDFSFFLYNHYPEFSILQAIKNRQAETNLCISQPDLEEIHRQHSAFFLFTPTLDDFIQKGMFAPIGDGKIFSLNFRQSGWSYEAINDRSGALLWKKLLDSAVFSDDEDRIHLWYYRTVYYSGYVNIDNFFSQGDKLRFLDAALQVVVKESDLTSGNEEYLKLKFDSRHSHARELITNGLKNESAEYIKSTEDLFELCENFESLTHGHGDDLLITQSCRHALTYFIGQLVRNEVNFQCKHIKILFEDTAKRPFVFWYTCLMIHHWRPDLLPALANEEKTASLAFSLMYRIEVTNYVGNEEKDIKDQLLTGLFFLITERLAATPTITDERKAKIVFQCLLKATIGKFKNRPDQEHRLFMANKIRKIFAETELPGTAYDGALKIKNWLFPQLLDEIYLHLSNYKAIDNYENGIISLPVVELDITEYLFELASLKDSKGVLIGTEKQFLLFSGYFISTYLGSLNQQDVIKRDFFGDGKVKTVLPSWSNNKENELQVNWGRLFLYLEQTFHLDELLTPTNLVFPDSTDKYDEFSRFVAHKLRTHVLILIHAFNRIYAEQRQLKINSYPVERVLSKIENKITDYVMRYSLFDPGHRRYDIFNESLERWFGRKKNEELLPLVGSILNRFQKENRQAILKELVKSDQLLRSLKLLEDIVSEEERSRLLRIIAGEKDIAVLFDKLSFQDMQFVVMSLSTDEKFIKPAEEALAYTELFAEGKKWGFQERENQVFIYRMKLLQAYQKADSLALDQIEDLPVTSHLGSHFSSTDEKDFYRALLFLKKQDGESAYHLFNELVSKSADERPVLALNRFAAKLKWSDMTTDLPRKRALAHEALEEWEAFENSFPPNHPWPSIRENILFNRLHAHETLEQFEQFDQIYADLGIEVKMRPDFLEIRVTTFIQRKMKLQAELLLIEARQFHLLENGNYPDFIYDLEKITYAEESLDYLAGQYDRIFRLSPERLIQVIPDSINDGKDLATFVLNEFIASVKDMLTLINSLPKVGHEDKYSDLIMLSLNSRLLNYKWHAANLRSGFSDPDDQTRTPANANDDGDNPGEIDFGIFTANGERIAICEAMILEGRNAIEVQKHNLKIFNYDPMRRLYFVMSYYKGDVTNFSKAWLSYVDVVENFIEFPAPYQLIGKIAELKKDVLHGPIIVGKSIHGIDTELYHIFINVNYKLRLNKKKVRGL